MRVRDTEPWNRTKLAAIRRIVDRKDGAIFGGNPGTADIALLTEEFLILDVRFDCVESSGSQHTRFLAAWPVSKA